MTALLEFKESLKSFYGKYEIYISPIIKFFTALTILLYINANIGFMERLNHIGIVLIIAIACSILPSNFIVIVAGLYVVAHLYQLSLTVSAVALVLMLLMFLLYFMLSSKESYVVALTPIAFMLQIPYAIPLSMGLIGTPVSAVPVSFGIVLYYLIQYVKQNSSIITKSEAENMLQTYTYIIDNVILNKEMLITILAFAVTVMCVYLIRRLSTDYAWAIATITGAVVNLLFLLVGDYVLNISHHIVLLLFGMIASVLIVFLLQFFVFGVDYTRTEYVQFEDDEYYYYVKAVPKMTITSKDKKIKRINVQKRASRRETYEKKKENEENKEFD